MHSPAHHFIGIGGVGMSAIAQVMFERGGRVSGSDQAASATVKRLSALGIPIHAGHQAENLGEAEVVVVSTAVHDDNPELAAARAKGLAIRHRSEILADLMAAHRSVAVTGTHGKTTTTGMVASILLAAGADPTILVGGDLPAIGGTARTGKGPFLVAEADESDKSVRRLTAEVAIVTNLEGDHLEHYRDLDEIGEVMLEFLNRLPETGRVVACADDAGVQGILPRVARPVETYGSGPSAMHCIEVVALSSEGARFTLDGVPFGIRVPGRHNVDNASAAILATRALGLSDDAIREGLLTFGGVGRRFQIKGTADGVTVIDDYAHHPSEIRATLEAASLLDRRVWTLFQPHRYSRTQALLTEFADAFDQAAGIGLLDVYAAGEAPNGVTTEHLAARMRERHPGWDVHHWPTQPEALAGLVAQVQPGDVVLLMGAGNVYQVAEPLLAQLAAREAAGAAVRP